MSEQDTIWRMLKRTVQTYFATHPLGILPETAAAKYNTLIARYDPADVDVDLQNKILNQYNGVIRWLRSNSTFPFSDYSTDIKPLMTLIATARTFSDNFAMPLSAAGNLQALAGMWNELQPRVAGQLPLTTRDLVLLAVLRDSDHLFPIALFDDIHAGPTCEIFTGYELMSVELSPLTVGGRRSLEYSRFKLLTEPGFTYSERRTQCLCTGAMPGWYTLDV